mgnify:CR=1 FL=1
MTYGNNGFYQGRDDISYMSDSEESDYDFEPIEADESDDEIVPSTQKTDQK